ncbi:GNAT family N-acetyltransferase [Flavobacterium cerinum]|uniref:GNAT family N-acetyltransferase n=1 Tax=Flavobacterium cerinum TaxID=2502784 RepID=A0ABY5IPQ8_9FLAO|nr:GNAT family N-acetyltransferase [Flavobacterium cerinum]UUC44833.1 GNAT family N-acetyltransferase [Flavobacterium cerinum]
MSASTHPLDNPVYHSLHETHQHLSIEYNGMACYNPDYCPFGGFINPDATENSIAQYARLTDTFFIVGEKPCFGNSVKLTNELICDQMILSEPIPVSEQQEITLLQEHQRKELLELVNLVQPGYFKIKTPEMGRYYGIYKNGILVAVTGERMKMNRYTEISAVVTHPDHTGKGYASQLVTYVANMIFQENKIPYLHVASSNTRAIAVYEKLGFVTRRKISFWNFITL